MRYTIECFVKNNNNYILTIDKNYFMINVNNKTGNCYVYSFIYKLNLSNKFEHDYTLRQALTLVNSLCMTYLETGSHVTDAEVIQNKPCFSWNYLRSLRYD